MQIVRIRHTLAEAIGDPKDWCLTWQLSDDTTLSSQCEFCGQQELRITYQVQHVVDGSTRWTCQRCLTRYPVGASLDGVPLSAQDARAQAHHLTARLIQRTCQSVIRSVQAATTCPELEEIVVYYDRNLQLSPTRAARLFSELAQTDLPHDVRVFEVQTRSRAHQCEFGTLSDTDRLTVWPALSPQQRRRLISLGFAPARYQSRRIPAGAVRQITEHG
jgi:hypothetical protein